MGDQLTSLLRLQHLVRAELRDSLAEMDLTPVQNTVLHRVAAVPGSSSAELARYTHVTAQTMHKLVADLETRGLLALEPRSGHGRILDAHVTAQGEKVMAEADARFQVVEDRMVAGLDRQQRGRLTTLLQRCVTALEDAPEA